MFAAQRAAAMRRRDVHKRALSVGSAARAGACPTARVYGSAMFLQPFPPPPAEAASRRRQQPSQPSPPPLCSSNKWVNIEWASVCASGKVAQGACRWNRADRWSAFSQESADGE